MKDFVFHNPVKIVFGRNAYERIGNEAGKHGKKTLILLGEGSAKRSGLLDTVVGQLHGAGIETLAVEGVKPNPVLSKVNEAIDVARRNRVDMIIGIGGGSVIDSCKAVAAGTLYEGDVWDFFTAKAKPQNALPVLAVITLAATASEMNSAAVVTHDDTRGKYSFSSPHTFPVVSFLNPETTFTVPPVQTAYGGVDAITHLLEPYFNNENEHSVLQDNITEGMIKTIMLSTEQALRQPDDYNARASMMWSASLALNGLTQAGMGKTKFPVHMIEHSLSALYDVAHAAGLSIVLPGWLSYKIHEKKAKIAQLGRNVFGLTEARDEVCAVETISRLKSWFHSIGSTVTLEQADIPLSDIPAIADNAIGLAGIWGMTEYTKDVIESVLSHCRKA